MPTIKRRSNVDCRHILGELHNMGVSLNNKRNTKIIDNHLSATLIHHGSTTCNFDKVNRIVTIRLCGWDTVTTRGKIDKFLQRFDIPLQVGRNKGVTYIRDWKRDVIVENDVDAYKAYEIGL